MAKLVNMLHLLLCESFHAQYVYCTYCLGTEEENIVFQLCQLLDYLGRSQFCFKTASL